MRLRLTNAHETALLHVQKRSYPTSVVLRDPSGRVRGPCARDTSALACDLREIRTRGPAAGLNRAISVRGAARSARQTRTRNWGVTSVVFDARSPRTGNLKLTVDGAAPARTRGSRPARPHVVVSAR